MSISPLIDYTTASDAVREVFNDIMTTRGVEQVNNFWMALANHPPTLKRVWAEVKEVMAPGALDPLVKELIYIAVSATNNCEYCSYSHTASARAKGMSEEMLGEVLAVTALANQTNCLANGYRVPVDEAFRGGER